jgi:hypothetical protein
MIAVMPLAGSALANRKCTSAPNGAIAGPYLMQFGAIELCDP